MGSDVERCSGQGQRPKGQRPHVQRPVRVDGHTFWRATGTSGAVELTTATGIELDEAGCSWTVAVPGAPATGKPVQSAAREVTHFMAGVLNEMRRATRRATVRPPVPKPLPKPSAPLPATAPVPCPLCHGGAWPDCELCDGFGVVTQRQAEEWQELHG